MRMEPFLRKSLGLKAHTMVKVEDLPEGGLVAQVERPRNRPLRCGECGGEDPKGAATRRPARRSRDPARRDAPLWLAYAPRRVHCPGCRLRVEAIPWAPKGQRGAHALFRAVAALARKLDWSSMAAHFRLDWNTVAAVQGAVLWGLQQRRWRPLPHRGIDAGSRRKGQRYLTLGSDLERGRVVWVGRHRPEATLESFFAWLRPRRARAIQVSCCDMGAAYRAALRRHVPRATLVFDRFHLSQHLSRAVDEVRRQTWRRMAGRERAECKATRFLWLKNPENLTRQEATRLSALLKLNAPIVKASLLQEDLRRFWAYRSTAWAAGYLQQWLWRPSHSRLAPFQKLAALIRTHRDGILAWTHIRVTNGALEGMNNKVEAISHRAYGYRTTSASIVNIYHCCAGLPLP